MRDFNVSWNVAKRKMNKFWNSKRNMTTWCPWCLSLFSGCIVPFFTSRLTFYLFFFRCLFTETVTWSFVGKKVSLNASQISFLLFNLRTEICKLIQSRLLQRYFPENFAKFLRTPIFRTYVNVELTYAKIFIIWNFRKLVTWQKGFNLMFTIEVEEVRITQWRFLVDTTKNVPLS